MIVPRWMVSAGAEDLTFVSPDQGDRDAAVG